MRVHAFIVTRDGRPSPAILCRLVDRLDADRTRRCGQSRLFFAGEATERRHFGTAYGACLSGLRAAAEMEPPDADN